MIGASDRSWGHIPARRLFAVIEERGFLDLPLLSSSSLYGVVPREQLGSQVAMPQGDTALYKRVRPGDFVISMGSFDTGVEHSAFDGLVSPAYTVLRPRLGVVCDYYKYVLKSTPVVAELGVLARGIRQGKTITWDDFATLRLPQPAEHVQSSIARFLDVETARIDALVEKKQLLTRLIRERRLQLESRLVSAAVGATRLPIASLFRVSKGIDAQRLTTEYCHEHHGEYPVFSGQTSGAFGSIDTFDFSAPSGAIVVSTVGARVMSTTIVSGKFSLSQNCLAMIPHRPSEIVVESFVPQLKRLFDQLRSRIPDHMQPSLRVEDLKGKWLLVPSHSEQVRLASEIARLGRESNEICRRLEKQIELLVEHRQALITSAVTGDLEVPEVAA